MSRKYSTVYVPENLKKFFPNLNKLHIYDMPTSRRVVSRSIRLPNSSRNFIVSVNDEGKVYCSEYACRNRLDPFKNTIWNTGCSMNFIEALEKLDVITTEELKLVRKFKQVYLSAQSAVGGLQYKLEKIKSELNEIVDNEYIELEPPNGIEEVIDNIENILPEIEEWKENNTEKLEEFLTLDDKKFKEILDNLDY